MAKIDFFYKPGDTWFNEIEVLKFEANLNNELNKIKEQIENNNYEMSPIRPIAFPKSKDKDNDKPRTRQTFYISVRDQVTWLAVTNIIGPKIDYKMPFWSYGNRLFISVFYEENDSTQKKEINFGWYRHTSRYLYRKWNQSWPLYRRHIAVTARIMTKHSKFQSDFEKFKTEELENDKEIEVLDQNELLPKHLKVAYLQSDYWNKNLTGELYWASIDLKKFYPSIKLSAVLSKYKKYYPRSLRSKELDSLLSTLLNFPIDTNGWNYDDLQSIDIDPTNSEHFNGIPTGLFVAGFIANLAMLDIDKQISKELKEKRNIAHFRFVDDHVILADNFENMVRWLTNYKQLLEQSNTGACINFEKTEPESLCDVIKDEVENCNSVQQTEAMLKAKKDSNLDPDFPSPLMTQTLAKISQIVQTDFELLDSNEEDNFISDIEHLLVTEFPDQELRRDTRISFAATMLSRLAPRKITNVDKLYEKQKEIVEKCKELKEKKELLKKEVTIQQKKSHYKSFFT